MKLRGRWYLHGAGKICENNHRVAAFIKESFVGGVPQGWHTGFFYFLLSNSDGTCDRYYVKTMLACYCTGLAVRGSAI